MQPALEATADVACQPAEAATPAGKQPAVQPGAPAAEPQQAAAAGEASQQHPAPGTTDSGCSEDVTMATGSMQDSQLPAIGAEALDSDSRVVASHSGPSAAALSAATGPAPPLAAATRALKAGAAAAEGQPASECLLIPWWQAVVCRHMAAGHPTACHLGTHGCSSSGRGMPCCAPLQRAAASRPLLRPRL